MLVDFGCPTLALKVQRKAQTFCVVAGGLFRTELVTDNVVLIDQSGEATSRAYWLLNNTYKDQIMEPGKLTNEHKRAAIQACAVMAVRPCGYQDPKNITTKEDLFANQIIAMNWASGVVTAKRMRPSNDERLRFYRSLNGLAFPSLGGYMEDLRNGTNVSEKKFDITLTDDEVISIENMIVWMESISRRP